MDSKVDLKSVELSGLKNYDQRHKVQLEASHQQCALGVNNGFKTVAKRELMGQD